MAAEHVLRPSASVSTDVLMQPNRRGERPLESMLKRAKTSAERSNIIGLFAARLSSALRAPLADGTPLLLALPEEERDQMPPPLIPWPDVRAALLSDNVVALQKSYAALSTRFRNTCSESFQPDDHAIIWEGLLSEHCFGVLRTTAGDSLEHTQTSRERLRVVWNALQLLLLACSDEDADLDSDALEEVDGTTSRIPHTSLKGMSRGLLKATMGPGRQNFDPREPYRDDIVRLVQHLQGRTGARLGETLRSLEEAEPAFAEELTGVVPANALHDLEIGGAAARAAVPRLRLDAHLKLEMEDVTTLSTPEWVLDQYLDMDIVNILKTAGCIEKSRDLVSLAATHMGGKSLSLERLRFAHLHAAWMWAACGPHLEAANALVRRVLGLPDGGLVFPCKGVCDLMVRTFRARSEPKGLPRVLEKTTEALDEEVVQGRSQAVLELEPRPSFEANDLDDDDQMALKELLTPACYVCDIQGAEVAVTTIKDLVILYRHLRKLTLAEHGCQVVRTKNAFSKDAGEAAGGYKDLKVWLMLNVGGSSTMFELQVHLHAFHELKKYMHVSYECYRGSFDHPHLADTWQQTLMQAEVTQLRQENCCKRLTLLLRNLCRRKAKVEPSGRAGDNGENIVALAAVAFIAKEPVHTDVDERTHM